MTTFAERVFGRSFGRQPEIEDRIRGEALVLQSIASLTPSLMNMDQRIVGGSADSKPSGPRSRGHNTQRCRFASSHASLHDNLPDGCQKRSKSETWTTMSTLASSGARPRLA
jgi:hypothetical protein